MSTDAAEVDGLALAAFISRFVPLTKEGNAHHGLCPFHDADSGRSLKIHSNSWRCVACGQHEVHGSDSIGFFASWADLSREDAAAKLGNGHGLPDAKPITQAPLKRLPFWGGWALDKFPHKTVWIHELSGAVLVWREFMPERVHLGIIEGQKLDQLGQLAKRKVVLVPENNPAGRAKMQLLAAALYNAGHEKVMRLDLGLVPEFGTRELPKPGDDVLKWAKARSKAYPKPGEPQVQVLSKTPEVTLRSGPMVAELFNAAPQVPVSHVAGQPLSAHPPEDRIATPVGAAPNAAPEPEPEIPSVAPATPGMAQEAAPDAPQAPPRHPKGNGGAGPPLTPTERAQAQETLARSEVLSSMVYRKASSVRMRATDWLWPGKIPLGEICVIQGDPGLGKSQITASLCAIITRGGQWPLTREPCDVGSVIVLSAEDSTAKTIVPRLAAAGADLDRVTILQSIKHEYGTRGFSLLADMLALDTLLGEEDNPMAVIVDPISAYQDPVGAGAKQHDSHKNTDVRSLLRPVSELVDRRNVTMILINHLTKGAGRAITRGQGNMAFVAGPRAVWQVSKDKDDPRKRLFLPVKNNLADDSGETGLSFSVEPVDLGMDDQGKSIRTSRILWNDERVTITADEAAGYDSLSQDERGSVSDAQAFLAETLADGRMKVKDVETLAKASGHSFATLGRAKRALGVISEREGFGREAAYYWRLPEQRAPSETRSWVKDD